MRTHFHGSVYILQHFNTPHSHLLCGSVVTHVTVLVRRLWILDTFLQHTIKVTRMNTVARLLGFGVVRGAVSIRLAAQIWGTARSASFSKLQHNYSTRSRSSLTLPTHLARILPPSPSYPSFSVSFS